MIYCFHLFLLQLCVPLLHLLLLYDIFRRSFIFLTNSCIFAKKRIFWIFFEIFLQKFPTGTPDKNKNIDNICQYNFFLICYRIIQILYHLHYIVVFYFNFICYLQNYFPMFSQKNDTDNLTFFQVSRYHLFHIYYPFIWSEASEFHCFSEQILSSPPEKAVYG